MEIGLALLKSMEKIVQVIETPLVYTFIHRNMGSAKMEQTNGPSDPVSSLWPWAVPDGPEEGITSPQHTKLCTEEEVDSP